MVGHLSLQFGSWIFSAWIAVLAISLGSAFPNAEATGRLDGPALVVELAVEVVLSPSPSVVVAHVGSSTNQQTFQLGPSSGGFFSGLLTVPPRNQFVVIEAVALNGGAEVSEAVSLVNLGVDPILLGLDPDLGQPIPANAQSSGDQSTPSPILPILLVVVAVIGVLMTVRVFRGPPDRDGLTQDGQTQDGQTQDGQSQDGSIQDEPVQNGDDE